MFYLVPPAGTPVSIADLVRMVSRRLSSGSVTDEFVSSIGGLLGSKHQFGLSSGKGALTLLLKALAARDSGGRDEVIVPAYTCFTVPAAVIRAGLKVRPVDIRPETLDIDPESLSRIPSSRVLAIVACNLFGIPSDIAQLKRYIGPQPIQIIDDAAQALATPGGDAVCGRRGVAGILSFSRGKHLSTHSGGLLMTDNDRLAEDIRAAVARLPKRGLKSEIILAAEILLTSFMLRPRLYWLPDKMPFLGLGKTIFDLEYDIAPLTPTQSALGMTMIPKVAQMNNRRTGISTEVATAAQKDHRYLVPGFNGTSATNYLRLPLLARDAHHRDTTIAALQNAGVKGTMMYPSTIAQISGIAGYLRQDTTSYPGAEQVVARLLSVPVHGYVRPRDVARMIAVLSGDTGGAPRA
jgi:perosamine synthetase